MLDESEVRNRQQAALGAAEYLSGASSNAYAAFSYRHESSIGPHRQEGADTSLARRGLDSRVVEFRQPLSRSGAGASWLFDSLVDLEGLQKAERDVNETRPAQATVRTAEQIIRMCDGEGLSAPLIDLRDNGGIEIFCREEDRGLLIIINPDNILQVFGDFSGEAWRSRYDLSGTIWQVHLISFLRELRPLRAQKRA